ncbi:MAG: mannonate dehydratase [Treponema sp.]|nr:mannonate dehydratase [Treponema sp.]
MNITFRWFGKQYDSVSLDKIRQLPHVKGIISTLYGKKTGDVWSREEIQALRKTIEQSGLALLGIESVNVHESIKAGFPDRDRYIENYIKTLEHLGKEGLHLVVYNFMPVFDWIRSTLAKPRSDGSSVLSYDESLISSLGPEKLFGWLQGQAKGFLLPGWEAERLGRVAELLEYYRTCTEDIIFSNLVYFLKAIVPTCEQYDIKLALHPDDPPWSMFGIPRIVTSLENLKRIVQVVPSPVNGLTICTGSLGVHPENDVLEIIRELHSHIHFVHVRNLKINGPGQFDETAHMSCDGDLDMYQIMKTLYDYGYDGLMRPDHGRSIWGEISMPGYGLYDQALGSAYMYGLWEAIAKDKPRQKEITHG